MSSGAYEMGEGWWAKPLRTPSPETSHGPSPFGGMAAGGIGALFGMSVVVLVASKMRDRRVNKKLKGSEGVLVADARIIGKQDKAYYSDIGGSRVSYFASYEYTVPDQNITLRVNSKEVKESAFCQLEIGTTEQVRYFADAPRVHRLEKDLVSSDLEDSFNVSFVAGLTSLGAAVIIFVVPATVMGLPGMGWSLLTFAVLMQPALLMALRYVISPIPDLSADNACPKACVCCAVPEDGIQEIRSSDPAEELGTAQVADDSGPSHGQQMGPIVAVPVLLDEVQVIVEMAEEAGPPVKKSSWA
eukprot:Hpha_TRINITY_DN10707_c0_g1::TRINITY_DN10707_c0_g1_i1::g.43534::m.43534